jgi:hypothetical protein
MATLDELKQDLVKYVRLRLGDGIVDIEVDPDHIEMAYRRAVETYRQKSSAAYEESYLMMELQEGQNTYTLPQEVTHVRQIFRRTFGSVVGSGNSFDPFSSAAINVYLLSYSKQGGLATYDFYSQYLELANRMFGGFINFTFNQYSKQIQIVRDPKASGETVLLWAYQALPEIALLSNLQISPWIREFTYSTPKQMIGEAREKFTTVSGPQGGTSLNGSQLKAEATAEIDKLLEDLKNYATGGPVYAWIIG